MIIEYQQVYRSRDTPDQREADVVKITRTLEGHGWFGIVFTA
jgi:hypothetical protein